MSAPEAPPIVSDNTPPRHRLRVEDRGEVMSAGEQIVVTQAGRAPITHNVKCWPEPFEEMLAGRKTAEFRLNDRDFRVGDRLLIREFCPDRKEYTHREIKRDIAHVLAEGFGLPTGYAMLSLAATCASEERIAELTTFKDAVIDELVIAHLYTAEHETNAKKALHDAIMWNVHVALDPAVSADARNLHQDAVAGLVEALEDKLDTERYKVAIGVQAILRAVQGRKWLSEPGRGSYTYDDERYQAEFGAALDEIETALDPLRKIARDWSDCPRDPLRVAANRAAALATKATTEGEKG